MPGRWLSFNLKFIVTNFNVTLKFKFSDSDLDTRRVTGSELSGWARAATRLRPPAGHRSTGRPLTCQCLSDSGESEGPGFRVTVTVASLSD